MISEDLLEILRCPACVRDKEGLLELHRETWLICQESDCERKYPILDDIPVMLEDEEGRELVLAYLNPGDFFGEIGLFNQKRRRMVAIRMSPSSR